MRLRLHEAWANGRALLWIFRRHSDRKTPFIILKRTTIVRSYYRWYPVCSLSLSLPFFLLAIEQLPVSHFASSTFQIVLRRVCRLSSVVILVASIILDNLDNLVQQPKGATRILAFVPKSMRQTRRNGATVVVVAVVVIAALSLYLFYTLAREHRVSVSAARSLDRKMALEDNFYATATQQQQRQRLQELKNAVTKVAQESIRSSQFSQGGTAMGVGFGNNSSTAENSDPNASFHLGMELFGQDVTSLERNVQERLRVMELEVAEIAVLASARSVAVPSSSSITAASTAASTATATATAASVCTDEALELESERLRHRIRFLKLCSASRVLLDESVALSTPSLVSQVNCVESAHRLVKSKEMIVTAEEILYHPTMANQSSNNTNNSSNNTTAIPLNDSRSSLETILDALQSSARRQKLDLLSHAVATFHDSVTLTPHSIAVRSSSPSSSSPSLDSSLSSASSSSSSSLSEAYDVMEILGAPPSHSKGEHDINSTSILSILEATMRKFSRQLYTDILGPVLQDMLEDGVTATVENNSNTRRCSNMIFCESMDKPTKLPTSSSSSFCRLEWKRPDESTMDSNDVQQPPVAHSAVPLCDVPRWEAIFTFIQRVTIFVADHVLLQRAPLCNIMSLRLFGKPSAMPMVLNLESLGLESVRLGKDDDGLLLVPLLDALETACIPKVLKPAELGQLKTAAEELNKVLAPFIEKLSLNKLLPLESQTRLSEFALSFEQNYVNNRRCILLNEARDMIVSNDYHNTVQVGEAIVRSKDDELLGMPDSMAVFKLHQASVSDTAFKLMEKCRCTMDEAVEQPASSSLSSPLAILPATLYRTAREMLDLFRAIIPVTHGHEVANIPRTAAVLHNDCVFFAHHCLTLGLEYRDKFPPTSPDDSRGNLVRQTCVFVDMVPLFRDLADRSLGDMLDKQARQLVELVGERIPLLGEALQSNEILAEWSDAENAMEAAKYHLRHLSQNWKPVLSNDIFSRSMWYLIDVTFTLFLDEVAKAADVSSGACSFIHSLFAKATHDIQVLLGDHGNLADSRVWERFSAVGRLMDMSLADIQAALADGVFRSVTAPELVRLVTACFDDTPKRRSLLQTLANSQ